MLPTPPGTTQAGCLQSDTANDAQGRLVAAQVVAAQVAVSSSVSLGDTRQQCSTTSLNGVDPFVPY
jgi:hypothetical protein